MTNSRRLISPPRPGSRIVAGETGRLEVVKTALGNGSLPDIELHRLMSALPLKATEAGKTNGRTPVRPFGGIKTAML